MFAFNFCDLIVVVLSGDEFRVLVFVGEDRFYVSINEVDFKEYKFRDNIKTVWFLNVSYLVWFIKGFTIQN